MESGETVNPEINDRIAKIKAGQVPDEYKKIKVNIIPQDWEFVKIKNILQRIKNAVDVEQDTLYRQIGIRSHGKGIFYKDAVTGKQLGNKSVFWIEPDCFIVNIVFAWEMAVAKTTVNEMGMIASHRFPMYKVIKNKLDLDYITYFFKSPLGKELLGLASPGGAGRNKTLGQHEFSELEIPIPKSVLEQQKIAKILTTWDKGIELKQKLIAEKKAQKKWFMEKLLNPIGNEQLVIGNMAINKSKWEEVTLGEVVDTFSGGTPSRDVAGFYGGNINWIKSGELNNKIVIDTEEFITEDGLNNSSAKMVYPGYILLALYGATAGVIAITGIEAAINQAILAVNAKEKTHNTFLYHCLGYQMNDIVKKYTQGGQPNLNADIVKNLKIYLPLPHEQAAIAEILSTTDKEIELMEKQLSELAKQKKGLMQLLLTGIVRV